MRFLSFSNFKSGINIKDILSGMSIVIWIMLLIICFKISHKQLPSYSYGKIAWPTTFIIHGLTVGYLYNIYLKSKNETRYMMKWLLGICLWILCVDFLFYIATYTHDNYLLHLKPIHFLLYYAPCIIYCILTITFISKILLKKVLPSDDVLKISGVFFLVNLVSLFLFLSSINYAYKMISFETVSQVLMLFIEFILFDFAILGLIYSNNIVPTLFLLGIVMLVSADFFITYSSISQTLYLFFYGQLIWLLGLIFMLMAVFKIQNKHNFFDNWFVSSNMIKSKFNFWAFAISISAFLLFFILIYFFKIIDRNVFLGLPLFVMIFSVIVVLLSTIMARHLELLFKKIESNINILLLESNGDKSLDNDFSIEEFVFLQQYIENVIKLRDEKNIMQKQLGEVAFKMAHDVGSPLVGLARAVEKLNNKGKTEETLDLIISSINSIKDITDTLVTKYRNLDEDQRVLNMARSDNGNIKRYILLQSIVEQVIAQKFNEYGDRPCAINLNVDVDATKYLVYLAPSELRRALSNLFNNAYESLGEVDRTIDVHLGFNSNQLQLVIKDNGCGIDPEKLEQVLSGISLKHSGKGMGLSSSVEYFRTLGGDLIVDSRPGVGTAININIPASNDPNWFVRKVTYDDQSQFVVLDNDLSMINMWQSMLLELNVEAAYCVNPQAFISWYESNANNAHDIYFIDYDLYDKDYFGTDLIKKYNLKERAYLVTAHAEVVALQEMAQEYSFKLVPKQYLQNIKFEYIDLD